VKDIMHCFIQHLP